MNWISVNDRLPEKEIRDIVLVSGFDEYGKRYVLYAETYEYGDVSNSKDVFSVPGWSNMNVTHWMPLPEPPEE